MPPKRKGSPLDEPKAKKPKSETTAKSSVSKSKSIIDPATKNPKSAVKAATKKTTPDSSTLSNNKRKASDATEPKSKKTKSANDDWSTFSLAELKKELEARGLSKTGSKPDLVERLTKASVVGGFPQRARLQLIPIGTQETTKGYC